MSKRNSNKKKANNTVIKDENEKAEAVSESVSEKASQEKETPEADQSKATEGEATVQQGDQALVDEGQQDGESTDTGDGEGEGDQQGGESTDTGDGSLEDIHGKLTGTEDSQQGDEPADTDLDNLKPAEAFTHEELDAMWYEPHDPYSPFPFIAVTKTKNGLESLWRGGKQHFIKETVFMGGTFTYDAFRRVFIEKNLSVQVVKPSNVD